jgi:hypothetical protein
VSHSFFGVSIHLHVLNFLFQVDWEDFAQDIVQFLLYYLPEETLGALPVHLPRLTDDTAQTRQANGFLSRTLVGLAHSFGAGVM